MFLSTTTGEIALRSGSDAQAIRSLARAGFEACDFSMWNYPWRGGVFDLPDDQFDAYFTNLKNLSRDCGLEIWQTHAPCPSAIGEPLEDAHRMRVLRRAIRATALMGSRYIIIHPIIPAQCKSFDERRAAMDQNIAMYRSLIPDLQHERIKIAIENMFAWNDELDRAEATIFSTAEEMVEALEQLGNEFFCACLDIGHAPLVGQNPAKMIHALGPWLKTLHVHDNDGIHDQHTLPFLGVLDWVGICAALHAVEYPGTMNLEATSFLTKFPMGMEGAVLRMMADTANNLQERVVLP